MGCTASVVAEPEKPVPTSPVSKVTGTGITGTGADGPKPAIKGDPSAMLKSPKKGVSFRKKETDVLGPKAVEDSALSAESAASPQATPEKTEAPAAAAHVASPAEPAAAEVEAVPAQPAVSKPQPDPSRPEDASDGGTKPEESDEVDQSALKDALLGVPESADVFDEFDSTTNLHAPGEKLLEKTNVNKQGNLKHFGVKQSADRDMNAVAATQNLFKKSTGVVPKVFVESIFSTYDLNSDGTISQSELEALAKDLQADYAHMKRALIGDDNPDGTVSRDALMGWFYNEHSSAQMRQIFDRMDADGSGFIEAEEIPNVLKLCAENISEENVEIAMATLDRDGDMKVSFEEFAHWFNNDCKLVTYRSFFSLYANNGDGEDKIGLAELEEMLIAMGGKKEHLNVQQVMEEIDTNKNGTVELEEFIAWSVKHN